MLSLRGALTSLVWLTLSMPLLAADFSDPTWPCIQRKVERLSPGLMWPGPLEPSNAKLTRDASDLADLLSLRRLELDQVEQNVVAFSNAHSGDPEVLGQVFNSVFQTLSSRRTMIIRGIERFSISQIALSQKIDRARVEMASEMARDAPDYDKVDALEEQLDWDQLIYSDRQKSITYLCETPTLLEKRLFGVAQLLQLHVREGG